MISPKRRPSALASSGIVLLVGALSSLAGAPGVRAQEPAGVSALDALPGDTTFVVRLRSASDFSRKFKASPFYALKEHPDLKKFLEETRKKLDEGLAEARGKLGFDPLDLLNLVEGEVVFAVGGLDKIAAALAAEMSGGEAKITPGDLPLVLVVDAGASAPKLRENLGKLYEFAQKEGAKKDVEDFRGGKITTLFQKEEGPEKEGLERVYFGDLGSRVLVSVSRPYLEQTMANITAPAADALVKGPDFAATQRETGADSDLSLFLNIRSIAATARKNLQSNPMGAMVWGIVEGKVLGRSMKNLGASVSLRDAGIQSVSFLNNGGASDGIMGILKGQPFPARPSPLIPEDVEQFSSVSLNIQALYGLIKDIYAMAAPLLQMGGGAPPGGAGGMPDFDQFVEGSFQIKVKPLIDSLGNMFHFYQKGNLAGGPAAAIPNFVFALELKDEMPLKELIDKLTMGAGIQSQKYLDRDYYPLKMFGEGEQAPAIALADKHLVIGLNGDAVKELIRRAGKGGKGVGDTPGFQGLAGVVPSQVTALGYSSPRSFRDLLKTFKDAFARTGQPAPDLTVLGDVVQGSIGWAEWKDQGLYSQSIYSLKKGGGTVPREPSPAEKSEKAEKTEKTEKTEK